MPPGLNAGKVDMNQMIQLLNITSDELAIQKTDALVKFMQYREMSKDASLDDVIASVVAELSYQYKPTTIEELLNSLIHYNYVESLELTMNSLVDCVSK